MTSLVSLADLVDVVIGVDTHVATHSAAAVHAGTGAVLGEVTVPATSTGYAELVAFADEHGPRRAWRGKAPAATVPVWLATSVTVRRSSTR